LSVFLCAFFFAPLQHFQAPLADQSLHHRCGRGGADCSSTALTSMRLTKLLIQHDQQGVAVVEFCGG
jgi:hypothetical protein